MAVAATTEAILAFFAVVSAIVVVTQVVADQRIILAGEQC